ncbi:conserved hypothetical protein [Trichinella spiralis]|uniref:hypothetical protein n=1 Tax=Trichinella spiralis TaxID=6334 RepID=UPI0001EFE245|nr:conserved hypothetical protein [Trichinella spiralis]
MRPQPVTISSKLSYVVYEHSWETSGFSISASVSRQTWANCIFRFHYMKQAGTSADLRMRNLVSMVVSEEYFTLSSFLTIHTVRTHVEQNQLETIGVVEEIRKNMDYFALNVKLLINYAGHLVKSGG